MQAAIAKIESGAQEYEDGDLKVKKAHLATLYKREAALIAKYNRSRRNAGRIRLNLSGGV